MKLDHLVEAMSHTTHTRQLSELLRTLSDTLKRAGDKATELNNKHAERRLIQMQFGGILSRWFNDHYLSEVEPVLRGLMADYGYKELGSIVDNIVIYADKTDRLRSRRISENFRLLVTGLISTLPGHDEQLDKYLTLVKRSYKYAQDALNQAIDEAEAREYGEGDTRKLASRSSAANRKYQHTLGIQQEQANTLALKIINSVPEQYRAALKLAVSKADDKLAVLHQEMERLNIIPDKRAHRRGMNLGAYKYNAALHGRKDIEAILAQLPHSVRRRVIDAMEGQPNQYKALEQALKDNALDPTKFMTPEQRGVDASNFSNMSNNEKFSFVVGNLPKNLRGEMRQLTAGAPNRFEALKRVMRDKGINVSDYVPPEANS